MNTVRSSRWVTAALAALAASGCAREGQEQMSWARAALERNAQLEVVAADPQTHTFTVRVKDTGEVRTVRADQVMAAPLAASSSKAAHGTRRCARETSVVIGGLLMGRR